MAFAGIAVAIPRMPELAPSADPMQARKFRRTTTLTFSLSFGDGEPGDSMDQAGSSDVAAGGEGGKTNLANLESDANTRIERFFLKHKTELREAVKYDHAKHHRSLGRNLTLQIQAKVNWEFPYIPIESDFKLKESSDKFRICRDKEVGRYENHVEVAPIGRMLSPSDSI